MATAQPPATEWNKVLKYKFKKHNQLLVNNLNAANVIDFLFQEAVISGVDLRALRRQKNDPTEQCRDLLELLHTSDNPQAFTKLYLAMKQERDLDWLVERIDNYNDQSLVTLLEQMYVTQPTVGQVVHVLPEGEPVCGVTVLSDHVYMMRAKTVDWVEVYDVNTFKLLHCLTVPNARSFIDMTSCRRFLCLYISDGTAQCIHRLDVQSTCNAANATKWPVNDKPWGLSVTLPAHTLLVTCNRVRKIKEFTTHGQQVRELTLPDDVTTPWHTIQLLSGELLVSHGDPDNDPVSRVIATTADGRQLSRSHGGQPGSRTDQHHVPCHLAVDNSGFVFVVDLNNRRVTLLSPTLNYVCEVVSRDQFRGKPRRLCLDVVRRRLYVTDNQFKDGKSTTGRVVVFTV